jgi:hypothetical protein
MHSDAANTVEPQPILEHDADGVPWFESMDAFGEGCCEQSMMTNVGANVDEGLAGSAN